MGFSVTWCFTRPLSQFRYYILPELQTGQFYYDYDGGDEIKDACEELISQTTAAPTTTEAASTATGATTAGGDETTVRIDYMVLRYETDFYNTTVIGALN